IARGETPIGQSQPVHRHPHRDQREHRQEEHSEEEQRAPDRQADPHQLPPARSTASTAMVMSELARALSVSMVSPRASICTTQPKKAAARNCGLLIATRLSALAVTARLVKPASCADWAMNGWSGRGTCGAAS